MLSMKFIAFAYFVGLSTVAWSLMFANDLRRWRISIVALFIAMTMFAASICGALGIPD